MEYADPDRRKPVPAGPALNYQRPGGVGASLPEGWLAVRESRPVARGVEAFDRLSELLMSYRVFDLARMPVHERDGGVAIGAGALAGPGRVVDRVDESLVQGLALGTVEGNGNCGELRVELCFDEDAAEVGATACLMWKGRVHVLPGAGQREQARQRRSLLRLLGAMEHEVAGQDQ